METKIEEKLAKSCKKTREISLFYSISAPAPLKYFEWKFYNCAAGLKKELNSYKEKIAEKSNP
jgi:hypothetical protein